jgi:hypothetical protein
MINILSSKGNAHQTNAETPILHQPGLLLSRKEITNAGEDEGKKVNLIYCWWECKLVQPLGILVWRLIRKSC